MLQVYPTTSTKKKKKKKGVPNKFSGLSQDYLM